MAQSLLVAFMQSPLYPDDLPILRPLLASLANVQMSAFASLEELQQSTIYGRIDVLIVHFIKTEDFLKVLRDNPIRWVHSYTVGVDKYLVPGFQDSPIPLTNAKGVYSQGLAEFAMYAIMYFTKDIDRLTQQKKNKEWKLFYVLRVAGMRMLILGYGDMGREIGRTAKVFGIKVKGIKRTPGEDEIAEEIRGVGDLHALLPETDILVMCLPATESTVDIIGPTELNLIKPGAIVINLGRGVHLNEPALVSALESGHLSGAALDVYKQEPLPADSPLWQCPKLLMSPHNADHVPELMATRNAECFLSNLHLFQAGEILTSPSLVTKAKGY